MTDDNRVERRINALPWEAPPGYAKRRCSNCRFLFSTPLTKQSALCPDCAIAERRLRHGGPLRVVRPKQETQP
jgi:hypothetical protein